MAKVDCLNGSSADKMREREKRLVNLGLYWGKIWSCQFEFRVFWSGTHLGVAWLAAFEVDGALPDEKTQLGVLFMWH